MTNCGDCGYILERRSRQCSLGTCAEILPSKRFWHRMVEERSLIDRNQMLKEADWIDDLSPSIPYYIKMDHHNHNETDTFTRLLIYLAHACLLKLAVKPMMLKQLSNPRPCLRFGISDLGLGLDVRQLVSKKRINYRSRILFSYYKSIHFFNFLIHLSCASPMTPRAAAPSLPAYITTPFPSPHP